MRVFSLKVADDDPVAVYLSQTGNVSATLRAIVEAYLAQGGNNPPPPPTPASPAPGGGMVIDYEKLGKVMYRSTLRALKKVQVAIPAQAAQNNGNGHKAPRKSKVKTRLVEGERVPVVELSVTPDDIVASMGDYSNPYKDESD